MRIAVTAGILFSILSGCSHDPEARLRADISSAPQTTPYVSCSGFLEWRDCYYLANLQCNNGYKVISREENLISQKRELYYSCR